MIRRFSLKNPPISEEENNVRSPSISQGINFIAITPPWTVRAKGIVNLTDLRAFLGHAGGFKLLIVCIGAGWIRPKYEKFCIKLTILLQGSNYLVGDACTAADIYMHMVSTWDKDLRALAARCPNITRVAATVARRPSVSHAMSKHERLTA